VLQTSCILYITMGTGTGSGKRAIILNTTMVGVKLMGLSTSGIVPMAVSILVRQTEESGMLKEKFLAVSTLPRIVNRARGSGILKGKRAILLNPTISSVKLMGFSTYGMVLKAVWILVRGDAGMLTMKPVPRRVLNNKSVKGHTVEWDAVNEVCVNRNQECQAKGGVWMADGTCAISSVTSSWFPADEKRIAAAKADCKGAAGYFWNSVDEKCFSSEDICREKEYYWVSNIKKCFAYEADANAAALSTQQIF
jgi:hypothetical protein